MKKEIVIGSLALIMVLVVAPAAFAMATASAQSSGVGGTAKPDVVISRLAPMETCSGTGFCPSWLTKAYDMTPLYTSGINGSGQTVVIVDACGDPSMVSDLAAFDKQYKLPKADLSILYPGGKNVCVDSGWALETSLDVEWAHVIAPGAKIDLLVATSPNDGPLFGAWTYSLNHHLGNSISNSWINYGGGVCPSTVTSILKTATKAHVTVLAASGDTGAWGYKQSTGDSYPADCPQVLTVGGTTLAVKSGGTYSSESAWGGAGGGYVTGVKEAKYQVYAEIKDSPHLLGKSDVSADANPGTGVWVYDTPACGGWCVVGGTSVACPLWAAFIALANQIRAHHGFKPAGFLEPFLYTWVYGKGGTSTLYHSDFHDVKVGSDGWPAGKGWDVPTGLGSFIGAKLAPTIGDNSSA